MLSCVSLLLQTGGLQDLAAAENAAFAGYLTQLLLKTAQGEAQAGQSGSRLLLTASLETLKGLVEALAFAGGEATLAYLLPGTVSGLGGILIAAGRRRVATEVVTVHSDSFGWCV